MSQTPHGKQRDGARVPEYLPRPATREPPLSDNKLDKSPLGKYLKITQISLTAFSRAIGVAFITVQRWAYDEATPEIHYAYEIERITKGMVPMECWLGTPRMKKALAELRANQPAEIQEQIPVSEAGGFAKKLEKRPRKWKKEKTK